MEDLIETMASRDNVGRLFPGLRLAQAYRDDGICLDCGKRQQSFDFNYMTGCLQMRDLMLLRPWNGGVSANIQSELTINGCRRESRHPVWARTSRTKTSVAHWSARRDSSCSRLTQGLVRGLFLRIPPFAAAGDSWYEVFRRFIC
jgi:hypothetical protein